MSKLKNEIDQYKAQRAKDAQNINQRDEEIKNLKVKVLALTGKYEDLVT